MRQYVYVKYKQHHHTYGRTSSIKRYQKEKKRKEKTNQINEKNVTLNHSPIKWDIKQHQIVLAYNPLIESINNMALLGVCMSYVI
jgi:hypothetical protein